MKFSPPKNYLSPKSAKPMRYIARAVVLLLATICVSSGACARINYSISFDHPENHLFHVTMTIPDVHDSVTIQMPAWNATYQIRDFASRIENLHASGEDKNALPVEKMDKQTWKITGSNTIEVEYEIFWDEPGPFASQLNSTHVFMNFAEILTYVSDRRNEEVGLALSIALSQNWQPATAFSFTYVSARGRNRYYGGTAANYDALVDNPIEFGELNAFKLPGLDSPVSCAVHGDNWNKRELEEGLTKIVRYETQLMGGAPYDHYQFIFHIDPSGAGGGGMEHANSTAIGATSTAAAISTAAHEFFHLWNVKRIRPQSLEPVDYSKEMHTRSLWFAEGVTSTYGAYALLRTGLWTPNQFYDELAYQINELQSRPARLWQSVEESSLNAWLEKYPQYNRPEFSISYYNKGQLDGFLLDVLIRDATDNHKSLDDVMRAMNDCFAKKGRFYNDSADIESTVESVAGISFKDFFAKYVAGTDELPYAETLVKAGLNLVISRTVRADLGFQTSMAFAGNQIIVSSIDTGSPAEKAGLHVGDVLATVNGETALWALPMMAQQFRPGETLKLRIRHRNAEVELSFVVGSTTGQEYHVVPMKDVTEKQRRIREGLLQGKTN
jgi:predicted metalloprotease with PDZ domain